MRSFWRDKAHCMGLFRLCCQFFFSFWGGFGINITRIYCLFSLAHTDRTNRQRIERNARLVSLLFFWNIILAVNLSHVRCRCALLFEALLRNLILFVSSMSTPFASHASTFPIKYSIHNRFFLLLLFAFALDSSRTELSRRREATRHYESKIITLSM